MQLWLRGLPAGDTLTIEVLDIDLAITWPRIKLRYALTRGDQVLSSGEDQVTNLNYLMESNRYFSGDRLRYEKSMLDAWFDQRISPH